MARVIGIDFGTTNSVMAVIEDGVPVIIPNHRDEYLTPSVVGFFGSGDCVVGTVAKNQAVTNPVNTVRSVKRLFGSGETIKAASMNFRPEEIGAKIIASLKRDAEQYLKEEVEEAVITVPAYFSDAKRQAVKDAGRIAGLKVLRILNEPTAAALSYGLNTVEEQTVLVYDLGGGTFDVSILEMGEGVIEVKSTAGDNFLGGDDFDEIIVSLLASEFSEETGIILADDPMAMQKLKTEAEKAKIKLSSSENAKIEIPFISADESGPKHLSRNISRGEFESLILPLARKTIELTGKALSEIRLETSDVDHVLLVGGSTHIPLIRKLLTEFIGTPSSKVDPEKSVAMGAAIQAGIIKREVKGFVLVDVTPLSLGIEIDGGLFVPLIDRNTQIPCEATKVFTTISDKQSIVEIHILQGERKVAKENISLGKFQLTNITDSKKGEPRIEVRFSIDANGIVHVSAKEVGGEAVNEIHLTNTLGLSEDEIDKMMEDSRRFKESDKAFQERVETRLDALNLTREVEYFIEQNGDESDKSVKLYKALKELNELVENDDINTVAMKVPEVREILSELKKEKEQKES